jgi:hypothetical protein
VAVAAGEEVDDRLDVLAVRLLRDVADAGGLTALDVVVQTGAAGGAARLRPVTGSVHEDLAEQVERLAYALGVAERPEVDAVPAVALAGEVDPREVLVERDSDVWVRLVVTQPDVEDGPVPLDELLLCQQRLRLGLGGDELDVGDLGDHVRGAAGARLREVPGHPLAQRARLADVEHLPARVPKYVDAGPVGEGATLFCDAVWCLGGHSYRG